MTKSIVMWPRQGHMINTHTEKPCHHHHHRRHRCQCRYLFCNFDQFPDSYEYFVFPLHLDLNLEFLAKKSPQLYIFASKEISFSEILLLSTSRQNACFIELSIRLPVPMNFLKEWKFGNQILVLKFQYMVMCMYNELLQDFKRRIN